MVFNPIFVPRTGSDDYPESGKQSKVASANYMFSDIIKVYMTENGENTLGGLQTAATAGLTTTADGAEITVSAGDGKEKTAAEAMVLSGESLLTPKLQPIELVQFASAFLPVEAAKLAAAVSGTETEGAAVSTASVLKSGTPLPVQIQNYLPSEFTTTTIAGQIMPEAVVANNTQTAPAATMQAAINLMSSENADEKTFIDLQTAFAALTKQTGTEGSAEKPLVATEAGKVLNAEKAIQAETTKLGEAKPTVTQVTADPAQAVPAAKSAAQSTKVVADTTAPAVKVVTEPAAELKFSISEISTASDKVPAESNATMQQPAQNKTTVTTDMAKTTTAQVAVETKQNPAVVQENTGTVNNSQKIEPSQVAVKTTIPEAEKTTTGKEASPVATNQTKDSAASMTGVVPKAQGETPAANTQTETTAKVKETVEFVSTTNTTANSSKAENTTVKLTDKELVNPKTSAPAKEIPASGITVTVKTETETVPATSKENNSAIASQKSVPVESKAAAPQATVAEKVRTTTTDTKTITKAEDAPIAAQVDSKKVSTASSASVKTEYQPKTNPVSQKNVIESPAAASKQSADSTVSADSNVKVSDIQQKVNTLSQPHVVKSDMPVRGIKKNSETVTIKTATTATTDSKPLEAPSVKSEIGTKVVDVKTVETEAGIGKQAAAETSNSTVKASTEVPVQQKLNVTEKPEVNAAKQTVASGKETPVKDAVVKDTTVKEKTSAGMSENLQVKTENPTEATKPEAATVKQQVATETTKQAAATNTAATEVTVKTQSTAPVSEEQKTENKVQAQNPEVEPKTEIKPGKETVGNGEQTVKADKPEVKAQTIVHAAEVVETVKKSETKPLKTEQEKVELRTNAAVEHETAAVKKTDNNNKQNDSEQPQDEEPLLIQKPVTEKKQDKEFSTVQEQSAEHETVKVSANNRQYAEQTVVAKETQSKSEMAADTKNGLDKEVNSLSHQPERTPELPNREAVHTASAKTAWDNDSSFTPLKTVKASEAMKEVQTMIETKSKDTMVFQLDPENMGKMKVVLTSVENMLRASIEVETEGARKALEGNMQQLLQKLESNGVQVQSVQITLQNNEQNKRQPHNHNKRQQYQGADEQNASEQETAGRELGYNTVEYLV